MNSNSSSECSKMITGFPLDRTFTSPQHPTRAISTQVVSRKELTAEFQAAKQREMVAKLAVPLCLLYWTRTEACGRGRVTERARRMLLRADGFMMGANGRRLGADGFMVGADEYR